MSPAEVRYREPSDVGIPPHVEERDLAVEIGFIRELANKDILNKSTNSVSKDEDDGIERRQLIREDSFQLESNFENSNNDYGHFNNDDFLDTRIRSKSKLDLFGDSEKNEAESRLVGIIPLSRFQEEMPTSDISSLNHRIERAMLSESTLFEEDKLPVDGNGTSVLGREDRMIVEEISKSDWDSDLSIEENSDHIKKKLPQQKLSLDEKKERFSNASTSSSSSRDNSLYIWDDDSSTKKSKGKTRTSSFCETSVLSDRLNNTDCSFLPDEDFVDADWD